ncbi:hypothetical protein [Shimia sp.]|uniref:hypothetical protein n=1 Tax=Shimia sp. TaxID=1954381 RepID=UPI003BA9D1FF
MAGAVSLAGAAAAALSAFIPLPSASPFWSHLLPLGTFGAGIAPVACMIGFASAYRIYAKRNQELSGQIADLHDQISKLQAVVAKVSTDLESTSESSAAMIAEPAPTAHQPFKSTRSTQVQFGSLVDAFEFVPSKKAANEDHEQSRAA